MGNVVTHLAHIIDHGSIAQKVACRIYVGRKRRLIWDERWHNRSDYSELQSLYFVDKPHCDVVFRTGTFTHQHRRQRKISVSDRFPAVQSRVWPCASSVSGWSPRESTHWQSRWFPMHRRSIQWKISAIEPHITHYVTRIRHNLFDFFIISQQIFDKSVENTNLLCNTLNSLQKNGKKLKKNFFFNLKKMKKNWEKKEFFFFLFSFIVNVYLSGISPEYHRIQITAVVVVHQIIRGCQTAAAGLGNVHSLPRLFVLQ